MRTLHNLRGPSDVTINRAPTAELVQRLQRMKMMRDKGQCMVFEAQELEGLQALSIQKWVPSWMYRVWKAKEPDPEGPLAKFVEAKLFERICLFVICIDLWMAITTANYSAAHRTFELPKVYEVAEI